MNREKIKDESAKDNDGVRERVVVALNQLAQQVLGLPPGWRLKKIA